MKPVLKLVIVFSIIEIFSDSSRVIYHVMIHIQTNTILNTIITSHQTSVNHLNNRTYLNIHTYIKRNVNIKYHLIQSCSMQTLIKIFEY
jgi:hypothetical protein